MLLPPRPRLRGPDEARDKLGSVSQREKILNCFFGDVSGTPPAFAHATMDAPAFDATLEYCTPHDIFFSGSPPLAFRNGRLPVKMSKTLLLPAANSFAAEKSRLLSDHKLYNT